MEGATHFIEVYSTEIESGINSPNFLINGVYASPIDELEEDLEYTDKIGLKTVALWFIKPKVKPH